MKKNCKSHDQEIFIIERIMKHDYKNKRMLLKWKDYPDKFDLWFHSADIYKLKLKYHHLIYIFYHHNKKVILFTWHYQDVIFIMLTLCFLFYFIFIFLDALCFIGFFLIAKHITIHFRS